MAFGKLVRLLSISHASPSESNAEFYARPNDLLQHQLAARQSRGLHKEAKMKKVSQMVFGLAAYSMFLITFLYAIGFTGRLVVPKSIDDGVVSGTVDSIVINLSLLTLFALQHSVMARPVFKRWWTRIVPEPIERSTLVILASTALALLFWQWRPLPTVVWSVEHPESIMLLHSIFW